ncbi:hypothetical protein WN48_02739 [Eufriesea mexicana]|uniref:Uncharacterized protein n=1 Tax=Eufriesea mexicana TaxID=516756 RepID=A0A310SQH2_9HYME|nr:hypothetical protein WN48_02739 [Eufriesea mexicana]
MIYGDLMAGFEVARKILVAPFGNGSCKFRGLLRNGRCKFRVLFSFERDWHLELDDDNVFGRCSFGVLQSSIEYDVPLKRTWYLALKRNNRDPAGIQWFSPPRRGFFQFRKYVDPEADRTPPSLLPGHEHFKLVVEIPPAVQEFICSRTECLGGCFVEPSQITGYAPLWAGHFNTCAWKPAENSRINVFRDTCTMLAGWIRQEFIFFPVCPGREPDKNEFPSLYYVIH